MELTRIYAASLLEDIPPSHEHILFLGSDANVHSWTLKFRSKVGGRGSGCTPRSGLVSEAMVREDGDGEWLGDIVTAELAGRNGAGRDDHSSCARWLTSRAGGSFSPQDSQIPNNFVMEKLLILIPDHMY